MISLQSSMMNYPWVIIGVFNTIHSMSERSDYFDGMVVPIGVQDFQACLAIMELIDLQSTGTFFTWSINKSTGHMAIKLDRVIINDS